MRRLDQVRQHESRIDLAADLLRQRVAVLQRPLTDEARPLFVRHVRQVRVRKRVPRDLKLYPGAKHSFFNDRESNYDAAAAVDSWQRVLSFFDEHIKVGRKQL